jgi:hypothetical protein
VFNEGFYELFSLLEKHKGSCLHIRCHTFNTRAIRVAIVCSIIAKIFNPLQILDGHISTSLNDTHVLILCLLITAHCRYLLFDFCSVLCSVIRCSTLLFSICIIRKIFSLDPGMCSRYFDPHKNNCHLASQ